MKYIARIYFGFLILIPIILLLLPADFFDSGESICLSKYFLNLECLGCGITRAIQHLIHFEFQNAFLLNKLSVFVLPLLFFLWFKELKKVYVKLKREIDQ